MLITRLLKKKIFSYQMFTLYNGFCVCYISEVTTLMRHVFGLIISSCVAKMYSVLSKIHEYSIDYIIDILRQLSRHV